MLEFLRRIPLGNFGTSAKQLVPKRPETLVLKWCEEGDLHPSTCFRTGVAVHLRAKVPGHFRAGVASSVFVGSHVS